MSRGADKCAQVPYQQEESWKLELDICSFHPSPIFFHVSKDYICLEELINVTKFKFNPILFYVSTDYICLEELINVPKFKIRKKSMKNLQS